MTKPLEDIAKQMKAHKRHSIIRCKETGDEHTSEEWGRLLAPALGSLPRVCAQQVLRSARVGIAWRGKHFEKVIGESK